MSHQSFPVFKVTPGHCFNERLSCDWSGIVLFGQMESAANVTGAATLADGLQWTTLQVLLVIIWSCHLVHMCCVHASREFLNANNSVRFDHHGTPTQILGDEPMEKNLKKALQPSLVKDHDTAL